MARQGADAPARITAALQLDRGRWFWFLSIILVLDAIWALGVWGPGDSISEILRYDRSGIAAGGWWRLLTAHLVHLDGHHLILNELGLLLMWALFADDYNAAQWSLIVCTGALAISCGLWWWSPRVAWYVGASGVLHSVMAAGTMKHLAARAWDRWILLVGLCAKLAWEQLSGHSQPLVVVDAHLYGSLCGFALGAALSWRTAIIRHQSRV